MKKKVQEALGEGDIPIIVMLGNCTWSSKWVFYILAAFCYNSAIYSNFVKKDIQTPFIIPI